MVERKEENVRDCSLGTFGLKSIKLSLICFLRKKKKNIHILIITKSEFKLIFWHDRMELQAKRRLLPCKWLFIHSMTCHAKNPPTPAGLYLSNKSMSVISAQLDHAQMLWWFSASGSLWSGSEVHKGRAHFSLLLSGYKLAVITLGGFYSCDWDLKKC